MLRLGSGHFAHDYSAPDSTTMTHSFLRKACLLLALGFLLSAAAGAVSAQMTLQQIRGLVFTADGTGIMLPAHTGLMLYRDGRWRHLPDVPYELRALAVTKNAIYAIGRFGLDSPLPDARGLMKSTDGGLTWKQLTKSGESEFRLMAAGFHSDAVYLINTAPNPLMSEPGLYHTQDDGLSWQSAAAHDLPSPIESIAVHPTDPHTVAMGTLDGLYVSRDSGATFRHLSGKAVTAAFFDIRGQHVYIARKDVHAVERVSLNADHIRSVALPISTRDFITYIAQNPARSDELAVATNLGSVFVSTNGGRTWRAIAREGRPA